MILLLRSLSGSHRVTSNMGQGREAAHFRSRIHTILPPPQTSPSGLCREVGLRAAAIFGLIDYVDPARRNVTSTQQLDLERL